MAKIHSSIFGSISGKHGSAVAVTRKDGISYIRMHVIPHNPRTDKQQAHRSKIGLVSKSLSPFNPIFKHTMGATNGISMARSHAFKHAIVDEYPNFSIDYKKLMFSFGTLQKLQNATSSFHNGIVSINWDFKKMYNCHGNDSVSLVVFNKGTNQALHIEDIALRKKRQAKIDIHKSWVDDELYFWAYVRSGDKVSDSCFVVETDLCVCSDVITDERVCSVNAEDTHAFKIQGTHASKIEGTHVGVPLHGGDDRVRWFVGADLCVCPVNAKCVCPDDYHNDSNARPYQNECDNEI